MFSKMDFSIALEFVINFARDNDTTGAVTGAILGGYWGFDKLPEDLARQVIATNKEDLGIDLEDLAQRFSADIQKRLD